MQNVADRDRLGELRRMRLRDQADAGVALVIERNHTGRRAEWKYEPETRHGGMDRYGADIGPHHAADSQFADPSNVGGAADPFAAQVEAPGCERIAEGFARDLGRND